MMLLSDPVFWFAMLAWLGILLLVLCMCVVAARDDRLAERARADIESRRRDRDEWDRFVRDYGDVLRGYEGSD